jgi:hypothetical protein
MNLPLYPRERDPVPIVQEAGWAPGPAWTAAENLAPTGIPSPDRPVRSESSINSSKDCVAHKSLDFPIYSYE